MNYLMSGLFLVTLIMLPYASALPVVNQEAQVPQEYQELYSTLKTSLDSFSANLSALSPIGSGSPILGAELLPANSNRGDALLASDAMKSVTLYLDRFKELGVGGVTFPVGYPLYTPSFPRYSDYVQFYKEVVQEVRKRGMMVEIESSVLFANSPFSPITFDYSKLTFQQFEAQRKQMISAIIQDLQPDYLDLGSEPGTQYALTGYSEFNSPDAYTAYVNYILNGLNRGSTKLGAGSGTWNGPEYVENLAGNTNLDFIAVHVYPIVGPCLQRILTFTNIAKQHGKRTVMDEAWLYKVGTLRTTSIAANTDVFRNDAFSFWAPLDQEFLASMVTAAKTAGIDYISPFWSTLFFSYIDYDSTTATLSYGDVTGALNRAASQNILNDQFSSTGLFYKQVAGSVPSNSSTQSTATTTSTTEKSTGVGLILLVALGLGAVAIIAVVLARRR